MKALLDRLRKNPAAYTRLRTFYGRTAGLHWLKAAYLRRVGLFNGKGRARLVSREASNKAIAELLSSRAPFMVARYGSTEFRNLFSDNVDNLCFYSGFFPSDRKLLQRFRETYFGASRCIDFLCVWNYKNHFINKRNLIRQFPNIRMLFDLGVLSHRAPWVAYLQDRRILVIHPFKETIERQMERRAELGILPPIQSLEVLKAVQTIAGNPDPRFQDWFHALEHMKYETQKMEFDIALIGAGAYGLPLAAHVKSLGKQAIHVGGALQYFFGIRGQALKGREASEGVNEYWTYPSESERVRDYMKVEGGRYW